MTSSRTKTQEFAMHQPAKFSFFAAMMFLALPASATNTKEQCVEAHGRGQDLREQKRFVRAKEQFLLCNQAACPGAIQADCVKFLEQVDAMIPTVSFGARDDDKRDLPETQVFLDGTAVTSRLDDGRFFEADPGAHSVRFVHAGREVTTRVVLTPGDKGRAIIGLFSSPAVTLHPALTAPPAPIETRVTRSSWPLVIAGVGVAGAIAGGTVFVIGMGKVPAECRVSSHTCAAAPGDATFDRARSAIALGNAGLAIGLIGTAVAATGLTWYFALPTPSSGGEARAQTVALSPWFARGGGGVTVRGEL
jgi:hypothetical protein